MDMTSAGSVRRPHALVVAYHFAPDARVGTMRTLRLVRGLAAAHFEVTVLTGHQGTYRPETPVDERLLDSVPAGVRVVRARAYRVFEGLKSALKSPRPVEAPVTPASAAVPSAAAPRRSLLLRAGDVVDAALAIPDHESAWYAPAVTKGLAAAAVRMPDVIYSSSPPWTGTLVAHTLSTLLRRPWVADFRDPWGRAPWRGDRYPFAMNAARRLERRVIRRADRVLFVSRANRDEFATHYGDELAAKFRVVPNGCDVGEFEGLVRQTPGDRFVLVHAGSLYAGRTPVPLLAAVALGIREGRIDPERFRVRFIGALALQSAEIVDALRTYQLERVVEFVARVPRRESLQSMIDASALLLLQPNHAVAVPAKLYEYLAAGRPILAMATGETASLVERSGVGVVVDTQDERKILEAILEVMSAGSHRAPLALFDGTQRAADMVHVLAELLPRRCTTAAVPTGEWHR